MVIKEINHFQFIVYFYYNLGKRAQSQHLNQRGTRPGSTVLHTQ